MHDFLSPEWVDATRDIRERYADDAPPLAIAVRLNQVITDTPFNDEEVRTYIDTTSGSLRLELGQLEDADATITTDYELARTLIMGGDPQLLMQSFLEGRIVIQGDMTRLMALQVTLAASADNEITNKIATEIQAITN